MRRVYLERQFVGKISGNHSPQFPEMTGRFDSFFQKLDIEKATAFDECEFISLYGRPEAAQCLLLHEIKYSIRECSPVISPIIHNNFTVKKVESKHGEAQTVLF